LSRRDTNHSPKIIVQITLATEADGESNINKPHQQVLAPQINAATIRLLNRHRRSRHLEWC
jgi:hypothetical protein